MMNIQKLIFKLLSFLILIAVFVYKKSTYPKET